MPSKVQVARRRGVFAGFMHELRVVAVFALTAVVSYCSTGNLTHQNDFTSAIADTLQ